MIFFAYLDALPKIPEELIEQQLQQTLQYQAATARKMRDGSSIKNIDCKRFEVTENLSQWIANEIGQIDQIGYQIVKPAEITTHLVHTDSHPRRWVINYLLELGGENVSTNFYKENGQPLLRDTLTRPDNLEDLEMIYRFRAESNRWYLINSRILHDVKNLNHDRVYITLGIDDNNPFRKLHRYKNLISL